MSLPTTLARHPLFALTAVVLAALTATTAGVMQAGCATKKSARTDDLTVDIRYTEELARTLTTALDAIPPKEGETLLAFGYRARAALMASDEGRLRALALRLPAEGGQMEPRMRWAVAILVSKWASRSSGGAAINLLAELIAQPTTNAADATTPGRSPTFDKLEASIKRYAEALDLTFTQTEHVAYEVATSPLNPGDEAITFVVHADVVPADEKLWDTPPFILTIKGDKLFGRGTIDDKGPLVAVLAGLAALKKSGFDLQRPARLVIGTSEETHWEGIELFQKTRPIRAPAVVADGDFPLGVGEKGVLTLRVTAPRDGPLSSEATNGAHLQLIDIDGGLVSNQVPASATATLHLAPNVTAEQATLALRPVLEQHKQVRLTVSDDEFTLTATGTAAHGAEPERGDNAIGHLLNVLRAHGKVIRTPCILLAQLLADTIGTSTDAQSIGLVSESPGFGPATVSLGTLKRKDEQCEAALNLRWPPPLSAADVKNAVTTFLTQKAAALPLALEFTGGGLDPFIIDAQSPWVATLQRTYETTTGKPGTPVTVAGTTYAKAVPGAVTFGPSPVGAHDASAGTPRLHAPNEYITRDEFRVLVEAYTLALFDLSTQPVLFAPATAD